MSGTGKSTIGRIVADMLNYDFADSDAEIERRCGVQVSWIFEIEGESKFRDRESKVLDDLTKRDQIVVATGGGIVLRESNRSILRRRGWVACLKSSIPDLLERVGSAQTRPLLQQAETVEQALQKMNKERSPLYDLVADASFETNRTNKLSVARSIVGWYSEQLT